MDDVAKKAYSALVSLRGNAEFEAVVRWIEAEREKTKELLVMCSPEQSQRLQGEARAYTTVLKAYREAPDVIQRTKTSGDHPHYM